MSEQEKFELSTQDRQTLETAIAFPPTNAEGMLALSKAIAEAVMRVGPFYQQGMSMNRNDHVLVDSAIQVLSKLDEELSVATRNLKNARENLHFMYSGAGTVH